MDTTKRSLVLIKNFGEIDAKILWDLLKDGRKDFSEIAEECGITRNAVWKHYNSMKKAGIIVGACLQVNYEHLGHKVLAVMKVTTKHNNKNQVAERLQKIPKVLAADPRAFHIKTDIWVFGLLRNMSELSDFKNLIEHESSAEDIRTLIWTGAKNIVENLSFGLPAKTIEAYKKKPQPTINSIDTKRKIDETDLQIIDQLMKNGRKSFRKIAEEIGVTPDTIGRRYRKLKRNGTIKAVIQIKPAAIGYKGVLQCDIAFTSQRDSLRAVDILAKIPDVFCMVTMSGEYDLHVWILIRDMKHLLTVQDEILGLPSISRMEIMISKIFLDMFPYPRQYISTM